ncbi:hypothetical protein TNCV_4886071 [Trichonephila clavipes]|uniref:Uncharacterized protein n=1 Tax=Trichonephila clavipes TaxID=2585209 RepID=A0A8X6RI39_TRICX|nr:hypothetical protein TNCV_4886071 [Trichonephila clavipes]
MSRCPDQVVSLKRDPQCLSPQASLVFISGVTENFWVPLKIQIVRVQYFVRGGFVGYRSRASSKHLSPHLPVDELDSSGVKKGLRCRCKMHVWVSGPQRNRLDVDVFEK